MAFLVSVNGPDLNQRYNLVDAESYLGRLPECAVVIDSNEISRQHAKIEFDGQNYFVQDCKSRNKTFLNGRQLEPGKREPLREGDKLTLCTLSFVFHLKEPGAGDSSLGTGVFFDEESPSSSSTIMSTMGISSSRGQVTFSASPQVKLDALLEITRSLSGALVLDDVLPKVLDSLFKIFVQADRGFIALANEDGTLIPRWRKARREDIQDAIRISRTIVKQVIDSQSAILTADAQNSDKFSMSQSIADFRIRSMMCAPLINSKGSVLGVLQIDTLDQRKKFNDEDLEVLVAVATQAGIAIDNAQLHERALLQRAVERDLQLAHDVQTAFLPSIRPQLSEYSFFDFYQPMTHVGGDYFDYIALPDGRTAIVVADVVGHGVAAALLMAKISAEVRFSLASEHDPAVAVTRLNDQLSRLHIDRFVTMVVVVLDPRTNEVVIVNAGHMAPIHRLQNAEIQEPGEDDSGLPLGIAAGMDYVPTKVHLSAGESLLMFTDGINEASAESEMFGLDRVRNIVRRTAGGAKEIGQSLVDDVRQFLGDQPQEDDMCVVVVSRDRGT